MKKVYFLLKSMRPKQWVKNLLLFAGLIFDGQLFVEGSFFRALAGFALFSLFASSVYILNDIRDLEADKLHPKKKNRPIASGKVSIPLAITFVSIVLLVSLPLAYIISPVFFGLGVLYIVINLGYSIYLKHVVVLDVLILASFYVIRIAAGVSIIVVERFSPWLYLTTTFLALYLGLGKRRSELASSIANGLDTRKVLKSYTLPFLDQLITMVLTATIMTYSLYSFSAPNLPDNHVTMLTIPFAVYGVFRYLYLVQVGGYGEAPEEIAFHDRPLQITILLWGLSLIAIFYFF
ncbi:MAG: decaprenyl-phosphate phosphoribosyltransferase [Anaerolineales bacterium]|nr:decaprenyl-phosphate phosphoribosyltransferase [Anaerolineales bacterium]